VSRLALTTGTQEASMPLTNSTATSHATGTTAPPDGAPAARPFRDGLLTLEPPRLLGSRCGACGTTAFPVREFCPACRAVEGVEPVALSPRGRVHSFTVVRQAPPGVEVPYVLAWIDLPSDRVRLMSTVVGLAPEEVALNLPAELELTAFGTAEDGGELLGYRFRATGTGVAG
jgi:uncharacterized OB-fold protein